VTFEGVPFIQWEGPQSDLTLPSDYAQRNLIANAGPVVLLASGSGGVKVRGVTVVIAPEEKCNPPRVRDGNWPSTRPGTWLRHRFSGP